LSQKKIKTTVVFVKTLGHIRTLNELLSFAAQNFVIPQIFILRFHFNICINMIKLFK